MNRSENVSELAKSLIAFQQEVQDPRKDESNPFFKSKYVTLDNLINSVRPVLSKHNLAFLQIPSNNGDFITIKTILMHSSGEYIEADELRLHPVKNDPQGMGSAITYGRRYALQSILGIAWEEDDDGNAASLPQNKQQNTPQNKPKTAEEKKKAEAINELKKQMGILQINDKEVRDLAQAKFNTRDITALTETQIKALTAELVKVNANG